MDKSHTEIFQQPTTPFIRANDYKNYLNKQLFGIILGHTYIVHKIYFLISTAFNILVGLAVKSTGHCD